MSFCHTSCLMQSKGGKQKKEKKIGGGEIDEKEARKTETKNFCLLF